VSDRPGGGRNFLRGCFFGFGFDGLRLGGIRLGIRRVESVQPAKLDGHIFIDGAGVRLFFGDAKLGKAIQDFVGLDFQLASQLVDSNLLHRKSYLRLYKSRFPGSRPRKAPIPYSARDAPANR
jgi:hypothetical protein